MTITTATPTPRVQAGTAAVPPRAGRIAAVAGVTYSAAWIAGLAVWPTDLPVHATGHQVVADYSGHLGPAATQSALVHGLAAVALTGVVLAAAGAARRQGSRRLGAAMAIAGLSAALVSLAQCALGILLALWLVPQAAAGQAGAVFEAINRLDGVKMLALAGMAVVGALLAGRVLPRWLGRPAIVVATTLLASGAGYLLLSAPLAGAALVSGPVLFAWVTATGIVLGRTAR